MSRKKIILIWLAAVAFCFVGTAPEAIAEQLAPNPNPPGNLITIYSDDEASNC